MPAPRRSSRGSSAPSVLRGTPGLDHLGASLAVLAALGLYLLQPDALDLGPRWVIPGLEAGLLLALNMIRIYRRTRDQQDVRALVVAVIALVNLANVVSASLLVDHLLYGGITKGRDLLYGAVAVWLTNVIVYGLWFWQLDRGGPVARLTGRERQPDFQFPQMLAPEPAGQPPWHPGFVDYLYVGLTNAAAFSPTDTMPLSRAAKALMSAESLVSIVTVGIVAARAVNILN